MLMLQKSLSHCCFLVRRNSYLLSSVKNSSETQNEQTQKHMAIIASKIIKLGQTIPYKVGIMQYYPNLQSRGQFQNDSSKINQKSLRSSILDLIEQYPKKKISKTKKSSALIAKKILRSYFEEGVWVHSDYCRQNRFSFGQKFLSYKQIRQSFPNQYIEQPLSVKEYEENDRNKQLYKKIQFCPTYLVTGQIFQFMAPNSIGSQTLLQFGHYGIGKSHGYVLYRSLSDMIFRYKHLYCKDKTKLPKEINFKVSKLVYWNINLMNLNDLDERMLLKIIQRQCYESRSYLFQRYKQLIDQKESLINNLRKAKIFLSQIYTDLDINIILLCDQINLLAKILRKIKNYVDSLLELNSRINQLTQTGNNVKNQIQSLKEKNRKNFGNQRQYNENLEKQDLLMNVKSIIRCQFQKMYFLSSMNIQKKLINKLSLSSQSDKTLIPSFKFQYYEHLQHLTTKKDLTQFFALSIKKKIIKIYLNKKQPNNEQIDLIINKLKQIFLKQLIQGNHIIIPIFISEALDKISDQKYLSCRLDKSLTIFNSLNLNQGPQQINLQSEKYIQNLVKQVFQQINAQIYKNIKSQIEEFLLKTDHQKFDQTINQKKQLLLKLLYSAHSKFHQTQNRQNNLIVIKIKDFTQIANQKFQNQVIHILNRNLFDYDQKEKVIKSYLKKGLIIKLLQDKQKDFLQAFSKSSSKFFDFFNTRSMRGSFIQRLIILSVLQGQTTLKFEYLQNHIEKQNQNNVILIQKSKKSKRKTDTFSLIQNRQRFFLCLPVKLSKNQILQKNFKRYKLFEFTKSFEQFLPDLNDGNHFILPTRNFKQVFQQSKLIDFVIIQKFKDLIYINIFDPTVSEDEAIDKLNGFIEEYFQFMDSHITQINIGDKNYKIQINYTVLIQRLTKYPISSKIKFEQIKAKVQDYLKNILQYKQQHNTLADFQKQKLQRNINIIKDYEFENYGHVLKFYMKGQNSNKKDILLNKLSVSSFFDMKIQNKNQNKVLIYKKLLNQYRAQLNILKALQE